MQNDFVDDTKFRCWRQMKQVSRLFSASKQNLLVLKCDLNKEMVFTTFFMEVRAANPTVLQKTLDAKLLHKLN